MRAAAPLGHPWQAALVLSWWLLYEGVRHDVQDARNRGEYV